MTPKEILRSRETSALLHHFALDDSLNGQVFAPPPAIVVLESEAEAVPQSAPATIQRAISDPLSASPSRPVPRPRSRDPSPAGGKIAHSVLIEHSYKRYYVHLAMYVAICAGGRQCDACAK